VGPRERSKERGVPRRGGRSTSDQLKEVSSSSSIVKSFKKKTNQQDAMQGGGGKVDKRRGDADGRARTMERVGIWRQTRKDGSSPGTETRENQYN